MNATSVESRFEPPGGGCWELESTHFTKPVTRFCAEMMEGMPRGFAEGTARYGVMLDHLLPKVAGGFVYLKAVPFGAPPDAKGPPPRPVFFLLTRLHPGVRRRLRAGHDAFTNKLWREDMRTWEDEVKPASVRAHRALQSVDLRGLDDAGLGRHLAACREHCERMVAQHHRFTITCALPVGDLIAHVQTWTGKPAGEILALLKGSSPISRGAAAAELDALGDALRGDADARAVLAAGGGDARATLDALVAAPDPVGAACRAYIDTVGYRTLGFDVADPYALELPGVLMSAIAMAARGRAAPDGAKAEAVAQLRNAVPAAHRAEFDELLAEARAVNCLRDERGHYSDCWATGLARRAILEVGRRLAERGAIDDPCLAIDASHDELQGLLRGEPAVSADELSERRAHRATRTIADAPPWLGAPPAPPPPAEWLPEIGRRTARATVVFMSNLFDVPARKPAAAASSVAGLPVSPGVYEGTARLIMGEGDFARIEQGDVLVTRSTSAYFNVVLPLLGAIVTDRGGQLSHAAIVAREYGIPGVVGTTNATREIRDGARVRVDGTRGEVHVLD